MSELSTLAPLTPEDFDFMMGQDEAVIKIPFGMDVMVTMPGDERSDDRVCALDTGTGDNEDEAPPVHDPNSEGAIDSIS